MKKALLFLSVIIWSVVSFAQQGTLQVGALGGPQTTWLINHNDSNDPNVKYANGWRGFGGVSVDYNFSATAGVGLEFIYSLQGQNYVNGPTNIPYKYVVDYLKIPLLLNFTSNPESVVMFVGKFGPYAGFATGADIKVSGAPNTDISQYVESTNMGMILGLGLGVNIKHVVVITAGIRLDGQLTDALMYIPDPYAPSAPNANIPYFSTYDHGNPDTYDAVRSRTWSVAGGIEFGVKYIIPVGKQHGYHRR